jgi:UDP-glucose 4-epimerase
VKLSSEKLIQSLFSSGAIEKVLVTRFPNVTGIRQGHGVVKKLVSKYFDTNEEWTILGDGFQEKPYIHAREFEDVLLAGGATLEPGPLLQIHILSDTTSTVRAITEEIESYRQKERTPRFGQTAHGWKVGIPKYEFDTSKLKLLGIQVSPSRDAITRSVREEVATYID